MTDMKSAQVWRKFNIPNVPSSELHQPDIDEVAAWGTGLEDLIAAVSTGGKIYATAVALNADLGPAANTLAIVIEDTAANIGTYRKVGAPNTGSWAKVSSTVSGFQVMRATNSGAGTANAIVTTTPRAIPSAAFETIILVNFTVPNTGAMTWANNGGSAVPLKSSSGLDLPANAVLANQVWFAAFDGTNLRLIGNASPELASQIAAAQAARTGAEAARDEVVSVAATIANIQPFTTPPAPTEALNTNPAAFLKFIDPDGVTLRVPAYPMPTDLFIIVGESGAVGQANDGSPPTTKGDAINVSTITYPLTDTAVGANTQSKWPMWVNEWTRLTGRRAAVCMKAVGSSRVLAASGTGTNHWGSTGALRAAAITAAGQAIAAINADPTRKLGKVYVLVELGRNDTDALEAGTVTQGEVEAGYTDLFNALDAGIADVVSIGVFRCGSRNDRTVALGHFRARQAQEAACNAHAKARIITRVSNSFPADALDLHKDQPHAKWGGLRSEAITGARELNKASETAIPSAPVILGTPQQITDTNVSAVTPITVSHTTAANTKEINITLAASRLTSGTDIPFQSVTWDGVAMLRRNATDIAGQNSTPNCRVDVASFYIDEATYGSSLSGITKDIVVSTGAVACEALQGTIYDLDAATIIDQNASATINGATGGTLGVTFYPGAPTLALAVCGWIGLAATAQTATISGLTEVQDSGNSNGTSSGTILTAQGTLTEAATTVTVTFSVTARAAGLLVSCLRKKADGE